jgi:hypothetical protein
VVSLLKEKLVLELMSHFESRREAIIDLIRSFVEIETPSGDPARIGLLAELLARLFREIGARVEIRHYRRRTIGKGNNRRER